MIDPRKNSCCFAKANGDLNKNKKTNPDFLIQTDKGKPAKIQICMHSNLCFICGQISVKPKSCGDGALTWPCPTADARPSAGWGWRRRYGRRCCGVGYVKNSRPQCNQTQHTHNQRTHIHRATRLNQNKMPFF